MLTRRDLLKLFPTALAHTTVASITGYSTYHLNKPNQDPRDSIAEISLNYIRAEDVINAFVHANSGFLAGTYSIFFPEFMAKEGSYSYKKLKEAAAKIDKKNSINPHRIDVIPAVAAAHWLPHTIESNISQNLSEEILIALNDPRREVKEIILQNLISTAQANFDNLRFYDVSYEIIKEIENLFLGIGNDDSLFSPVVFGLEFMLNANKIINRKGGDEKKEKEIKRVISLTVSSKNKYSWYFNLLINSHDKTFVPNALNHLSLPPQSSEALMGWKFSGEKSTHNYYSLLAIGRAILLKSCLDIARDPMAGSPAMSSVQATIAYPKLLDFMDSFGLIDLIISSPYMQALKDNDKDLYEFMKSNMNSYLINKEVHIKGSKRPAMSQEGINLGSLVPFSQFNDKHLLSKIISETDQGYEKAIGFGALAAATSTFMTTTAAKKLGEWLANRPGNKVEYSDKDVLDILRDREKSIDAGDFIGVEEDQKNLGDIPEDIISRK